MKKLLIFIMLLFTASVFSQTLSDVVVIRKQNNGSASGINYESDASYKAGDRIKYIIDDFGNYYEYDVVTETTAGQTPYTNPELFYRVNPSRSTFELKNLYRFFIANTGTAPTYSSITYTFDGVNYSATVAFSATAGSILIYNHDTRLQVQAIALNNAKYICYNTDNDKLYVTTNSNTIVCYSPTGALVGSYDIDNSVVISGMSNIESVGTNEIALYAWNSATVMTYVYHVTIASDGTFTTVVKKAVNTGNNTGYSKCKYVSSNNRLYIATSVASPGGARNKGYYMNLDINAGAFVNTIVTVNLTAWESSVTFQMYSDLENVGDYLYLNCNYGLIRTDLNMANEKAIILGATSNKFIDDVDVGTCLYNSQLNKILISRYPKYTIIRGSNPMIIYQLDIDELEAFTDTINAARNVYMTEFYPTPGSGNFDVNFVGIDKIKHNIIVATKDVHCIKFYRY